MISSLENLVEFHCKTIKIKQHIKANCLMLKYKTQVREQMKYTKQVFFLSYYKGLMSCIKIGGKYIL